MLSRYLWIYLLLSIGLLESCSTPSQPSIDPPSHLKAQVAQTIYDDFTYSEAEVYLTNLAKLSDQEIFQYSDRVCETIRRGKPFQTIQEELREQVKLQDEKMSYLQIAIVTERQRCPESNLPQQGWRRSLFFLQEQLNGGDPL